MSAERDYVPPPSFADWSDIFVALLCSHGLIFLAGYFVHEYRMAKALKPPLAAIDTRPRLPAAEVTPMRWQCTDAEFRRVQTDFNEYRGACRQRARAELTKPPKG